MQLSSLSLAMTAPYPQGLTRNAVSILQRYGTNAHIYLPGVGTISGLTAGNYLDSAGVTAASVDNPVGLSLDALQAMTLGVELVVGANNVSNNGWTPVGSGGVKVAGGATGSLFGPYGSIGPTYLMVVVVSAISGTITPQLGWSPQAVITSPGTYQYVVKPSGGAFFYLDAPAATTATVTSVSVREIPGIHATQATTANKPILRRGLLNQLLWSQDPSNAAWTKTTAGTGVVPVITGGFTDPFGGANASRLQLNCGGGTTGSDISYLTQDITTVNSPMTAVYYLKTNDGSTKIVTLRAGVAVFQQTEITPDWTVYAVPSSTSNDRLAILLYGNNGVQTADLLIYRAGLFQGTYTAQQIIDAGGIPLTTSAAASSTTGKYWWQFDGSNDSLLLSAPLFQMSDDHCVIVGASPTSGAASTHVFQSGNGAASQQVCTLKFQADMRIGAVWCDDATSVVAANAISPASFSTAYVATGSKVGTTGKLRVNGVQQATSSLSGIGTTTITTNGIIGAYKGGAAPFIGSIYPVIAIKGTVTDSDLLTLERFVGQLSGVSI